MKKIHLIFQKSLILFSVILSGCAHLSGLSVCTSDPDKNGMECSKNGEKPILFPYKDTSNFICMPSQDARTLYERLKTCEAK